jgi:hypothetical protein
MREHPEATGLMGPGAIQERQEIREQVGVRVSLAQRGLSVPRVLRDLRGSLGSQERVETRDSEGSLGLPEMRETMVCRGWLEPRVNLERLEQLGRKGLQGTLEVKGQLE